VVVEHPVAGLECPYTNGELRVCRIPQAPVGAR